MDKKYLIDFCNYIDFPKEATECFADAFTKLLDFNCLEIFKSIADSFINKPEDNSHVEALEELSKQSGVHIYTVNGVFLVYASKASRKKFEELGYSEEIFHDTLQDMTYKANECKNLHGIWGVFVLPWCRSIHRGVVVKLGRLEFNTQAFEYESYKHIKKGDLIYNCHIPSAGPMTEEDVKDSLNRAYDFFNISGEMPLHLHSWLIYPPHRKLFPDGSNLAKFYDMFDIFYQEENDNNDFWRIFYCDKSTDLNSITPKTGLQQRFLDYLKAGNKMGVGVGMLFYKKEK